MISQEQNGYEQILAQHETTSAADLGHVAITGSGETTIQPTEEQLRLLSASTELASTITEQFPQVDESGKLNYAIAGSLSVMLLAQANRFEVLGNEQETGLRAVHEVTIPDQASTALKTFARHLGDFDYAQTTSYRAKKNAVQAINYRTNPDAYREGRATHLFKGGTDLDNLGKNARDLMKLPDGHILFAEAVGEVTSDHSVRLEVEGKEFIIVDPRIIVAFKTVHLLESFDTTSKPQKYINDLSVLRAGLKDIYSDEELVEITHDMLMDYAKNSPNGLEIPYHNAEFTEDIKGFVDQAVEADIDAPYLDSLEIGRERAIGILKILHKLETPEAKQQVIGFINKHKEAIDKWDVNDNSEQNINMIAQFLDANKELRDELIKSYGKKEAEDHATNGSAHWLRNSPYRGLGLNNALKAMKDHSQLDHMPIGSEYLDLLMYIDEADVTRQLDIFSKIIDREATESDRDLYWLFKSDAMQDLATKQVVVDGLEHAINNFDDEKLRTFVTAIRRQATKRFDENINKLSLDNTRKLISETFKQFGVIV